MPEFSDAVADVEIGLEINRALLSRSGDAAAIALADFIRIHHMVISREAWEFLEHAVKAQRMRQERGKQNGRRFLFRTGPRQAFRK